MPDPAGLETQPEEESLAVQDAAERVPAEIDGASLRKYFTLADGDFGQVAQCCGASNKLGFSVQLCTLRWRDRFLADMRDVPEALLQMLAPQLGLLPMPLIDYPQDDKTRSAYPTIHPVSHAWDGSLDHPIIGVDRRDFPDANQVSMGLSTNSNFVPSNF